LFERQRIMLEIIKRTPSSTTHTHLMKWLFLMKHETETGRSPSFYDFVPYKYGPFSFLAYRELGALRSDGLVGADTLSIPDRVQEIVSEETSKLSRNTRKSIDIILLKYGRNSRQHLTDDIYKRYPWYASLSELKPTVSAVPAAALAVYTVGYEGRSVDALIDLLLHAGISRLIDVRKNAFSRKYGFSGKTLRKICTDTGIEYIHTPSLGIPSNLRSDLDSDMAYTRLFDRYEKEILPFEDESIQHVARMAQELPSAMMCFEKDSNYCHRGRLAKKVSKIAELPIQNL